MALSELPPPHRRAVHATLQLMDERMEALRALLSTGTRHSALLHMEDDLPQGCTPAVLDHMEKLAARVARAANDLGLPAERRALSRECASSLALLWELAPDLRPGRMTGYGPLPEHLAPELSALSQDLEQRLLGLMALLETPRP